MDAHRLIARRRTIALVALALVVAAGLVVHSAFPDTAASDIAGDALYAAAVYLFVVAVMPRWRPIVAAALAAGWCIAIELFQLTGVPEVLGAQFAPVMLVLGTVFDARDLVVYPLAIVMVAAADALFGRERTTRPQAESG